MILPGGQGKQLTLQPKFTTAALSCHPPVCIDKKASEKEVEVGETAQPVLLMCPFKGQHRSQLSMSKFPFMRA